MGLPADVHSFAILPIGYPLGRFGPVRRGALADVVTKITGGRGIAALEVRTVGPTAPIAPRIPGACAPPEARARRATSPISATRMTEHAFGCIAAASNPSPLPP
jgi:hypothetical protein